eukprot:g24573.t1
MHNLMMLHFSTFHPKNIKTAIRYGQAPCMHRICSDEKEQNGHLKVRKDALTGTGYNAQLIDHQFRRATAKNCNDLLRRQTRDTTDRVSFVIQYFPREERLCHVPCSLQHIINDNEQLAKVFPTPLLFAFKQPPNLKQTIVHSKLFSLQDNIDHNTTQPCIGNLCKTYQIINMDTTISRGNTTHRVDGRYSCDSANVVYLIRCRQGCPGVWYIGETMQTLRQQMNGQCATIARQGCSLPVGEHINGQGHSASDLRVNAFQGGPRDTQQRRVTEQRLITKFSPHEDSLNQDLGFMLLY